MTAGFLLPTDNKKGAPFSHDIRRMRGKSDRSCQRFENWNELGF
jgi:hypothetical protein